MTQVAERVFRVVLRSTDEINQTFKPKAEEADNIRDCLLDGMGYPLSLDDGSLTVDVTCESLEHKEKTV
jgi:hypothetical protein